jgi:hypothetical protein
LHRRANSVERRQPVAQVAAIANLSVNPSAPLTFSCPDLSLAKFLARITPHFQGISRSLAHPSPLGAYAVARDSTPQNGKAQIGIANA